MESDTFAVEPFSIPLGEDSISAVVRLDRSRNLWDVTVVISRAPDQPQIRGEEIGARLIDDRGTVLKMVAHPSGPLVEAGGSLGTSVNAQFQFQGSNAPAAQLLATYQGQTVRFRMVPAQ